MRYEEIILGQTCCEEALQFVPACREILHSNVLHICKQQSQGVPVLQDPNRSTHIPKRLEITMVLHLLLILSGHYLQPLL